MKQLVFGLWMTAVLAGGAWAQSAAFTDEEQDVLSQLKTVITLHDWLAVLDHSDPEHRAAQIGAGMTHAQYVAELLGLFHEGNSIAGEDGKIGPGELNRIRQLQWRGKGPSAASGVESILGTVTLDDGQTLLLEIQWRKLPDGRYVLTGALG